MHHLLLYALIGLGLLGMAGIYLVPARYIEVLRGRVGMRLTMNRFTVVVVVLNLLSTSFAALAAIRYIPHVLACLYGSRCSAAAAGGLLFLASFGATVLIVELIWWASVFFCRRFAG